jgi:tripartite tricarboxylate transporter TctB family protein
MTIRNKRDFYIGVVFLALSIVAMIYGMATVEDSGLAVSRGSMTPTSYPNFTLVFMGIMAMLLIAANLTFSGGKTQAAPITPASVQTPEPHPAWRRALGAFGLTALYPVLMPLIGYLASNILLMIVFIRLFGGKSLKVIISLSVGLSLFLYWFFAKVMNVMMP